MNIKAIETILTDTAYVRMAGTNEELICAKYLQQRCDELKIKNWLEPFPVLRAEIHRETLLADGQQIPCMSYFGCGTGEVEAPLYHLTGKTPLDYKRCRGKIVLSEERMGFWHYQDILDNGAVGFITYAGDINCADRDIDRRCLRENFTERGKIPGVMVHVKDAVELARTMPASVRICVDQTPYNAESHNVIAELPGECDEWIILSAHYDSVSRSVGSYDNMSGCIAILSAAEYFTTHRHRYGLRFIWCGAEEGGLQGSIAYCVAHQAELDKILLDINVDMVGSIMGPFYADCTAEDRLTHYLQYLADEVGVCAEAKTAVHSSDSTPFAGYGVPSLTFTRNAPMGTASIHDRYDTAALLSAEQLRADAMFITLFAERMANAALFPVKREIPENLKKVIDCYLDRRRDID